jgi:hypothetical protein
MELEGRCPSGWSPTARKHFAVLVEQAVFVLNVTGSKVALDEANVDGKLKPLGMSTDDLTLIAYRDNDCGQLAVIGAFAHSSPPRQPADGRSKLPAMPKTC